MTKGWVLMKGKLIVIEGPDGSGKSTQINIMKKYLEDKGFDVIETREPGGTKIGEKIRDIILDRENTEMDPVCEALLYAASRAQHVAEVIKPAIEKGKIVICTRYIHSSLVYQGIGRGLGVDMVSTINTAAIQGMMPDVTLLFDIDPEIGIKRKIDDGKADRLELEDIKFHKKVYNGYKEIASIYKDIKVIDASRSIDEIQKSVLEIIDKTLDIRG